MKLNQSGNSYPAYQPIYKVLVLETTNLSEQKGFTFTLIIKPYIRKNCAMDDMRVIYSDKTCLVAKNSKFGGLYIHPTGKIIKGRFVKFAGSNRYPILIAEKEVHIRFENFPTKPNIITDQYKTQDIITLLMDS